MNVKVYSTPTCGFCHQVKAYLNQRGVPFQEFDVSRDRNAAMHMVQISGQQGVPVVEINGQVIVGFNRPAIDKLLSRSEAAPARLGAAVANADRIAKKKGVDLPLGAFVGRVEANSVAAGSGLAAGDVIIQFANQPIRSSGDIDRVLDGVRPGQIFEMVVWRAGRTLSLSARF